ncbi:MAG: ABC transporter substrate-binding protein [Chloroflexi bacterium]|nr:ABC transporter substrate-binding protein [Chloroflexota bacterium]
MLRKWLAPLVLIMSLWLAACQPVAVAPVAAPAPAAGTTTAPTVNMADGCVTTYDAAVDYFPEKTKPAYTDGFSVEYHNNYKVVTVKTPWQGAKESLQYALVQCGTPAPTDFKKEQIIEVPVKRFVSMSTTYLPFLDEMNLLDRLVGLDDTTYVNNEKVAKLAADGKLKMIGFGAKVNVEQALDLNPDLIMTYAMGAADSDAHPLLIEAGLKVVVNAEWLDTSPLGRAEWGKFLALFFNREASADAMFAKTATAYEKLAAQAASVKEKPTVFTDTDYQGTWYVAGGQSFGAHFLADAGANYLWADDAATGSSPLAFEAVFDKAKDADFWLNTGYLASLNDLKAADARYAEFAAFKKGNVWNNNARANATGGNDYYESAIAHPDVVLADLIKILHPDLLPDHKLVYYQQLK